MAYDGNGVYIWDADHNEYKNIGQAIGSVGPEGPASTVPGPPGEDGITPNISATASVDANVGTPSVTVTKSGTDENPSFDFAFHNLKGNSGENGRDGSSGRDGTDGITPDVDIEATIDNNTGTPSVTVLKGGTTEAPEFTFNFSNLKGADGATGPASTVPGPTGATPTISATATVDNNTGVPSVNVIKTGTAEEPSFAFQFHNIKGADGANGQSIVGEQGPKGDPFTYADFTPAQLAALTGPSGSDGTRGSQIWRYDNMSMTEAQANAELWTNHRVQAVLIRNIDGTMATGVLAGDWVINMRLKNLVRLTGHYGATADWTTTDDDVIGLPAGATGPAGTITAWRVTDYLSGMSPAMQQNPPAAQVDDCFWLYTYYGPNNTTPKYGDFFYTADSNNVTTLGIISGMGEDGHEPGVQYPYVYFTDCSQLRTAQGLPGTSVYHVNADFTPDNQNRTFAFSTSSRTPAVGDIVFNNTNTYVADINIVDNVLNTYTVANLRAAAEKGDTGTPGTTPDLHATATVGTSVGNPIVTVTSSGTLSQRTFNFAFDGLKGLNGQNGATPNVSMTAQVSSDNTAVPAVVVTKDAHDPLNPNFNLLFKNIDKNYYLCSAAITVNTNIPVSSLSRYSQSVSASMLKNGDVVYNNEKMAIIGSVNTANNTFQVTGVATIKGTDGITPNISATTNYIDNGGSPSVSVTTTGSTIAPTLNFTFSNLKGAKGNDGATPDMRDYYTRDEVNALLYNLKGGGGVVVNTREFNVRYGDKWWQSIDNSNYAQPHVTEYIYVGEQYAGKTCEIRPYYLNATLSDHAYNVNAFNPNKFPENRTHVTHFDSGWNRGYAIKQFSSIDMNRVNGIYAMTTRGTVRDNGWCQFDYPLVSFMHSYYEDAYDDYAYCYGWTVNCKAKLVVLN